MGLSKPLSIDPGAGNIKANAMIARRDEYIDEKSAELIAEWLGNVNRIEEALDNLGDVRRWPRYLLLLSAICTSNKEAREMATTALIALIGEGLEVAAREQAQRDWERAPYVGGFEE